MTFTIIKETEVLFMLTLVKNLYEATSTVPPTTHQISDIISYLEQLLDGGHLADFHIANLQQLGLKALNRFEDVLCQTEIL